MILNAENVTLKRYNVLNPLTFLPVASDGEPHHDCAKVVFQSSRLWENLQDQPLGNTDITLFTDRSSYSVNGKQHTDYAVVRNLELLKAGPLIVPRGLN